MKILSKELWKFQRSLGVLLLLGLTGCVRARAIPPGTSGADRNIFQGTIEDLKNQWPLSRREEGAANGPGFDHIQKAA